MLQWEGCLLELSRHKFWVTGRPGMVADLSLLDHQTPEDKQYASTVLSCMTGDWEHLTGPRHWSTMVHHRSWHVPCMFPHIIMAMR